MVTAASFSHALVSLVIAIATLTLAEKQTSRPAQESARGSHDSQTTLYGESQSMSNGKTTTNNISAATTNSETITDVGNIIPTVTPTSVTSIGSCEARTINYITHTLPQLCLTNSWTSSEPTSSDNSIGSIHEVGKPPETPKTTQTAPSPTTTTPSGHIIDSSLDPASTTFMSFEDWKEMMLRKTGQDPQDLHIRQPNEHVVNDKNPPYSGHSDLGEEEEISLNFGQYPGGDDTAPRTNTVKRDESDAGSEAVPLYEDGKASSMQRSKDAGKTCKERFSYSSFDAGATILKTGAGAKNSKAILVENKDSYMLLECSTPSKYVIVELSDDILIDTVVLANFEFFSSMIRHFRLSVSDRYPVKLEKWRELGIFEARNSRDIQPFLVENPQIWAKYVKIEFLTQYGNEYYCPVSLLRVHGSRMLDSWKDSETGLDEETVAVEKEGVESIGYNTTTTVSESPTKEEVNATEPKSMDASHWQHSSRYNIFQSMNPTCPSTSRQLFASNLSNSWVNQLDGAIPGTHTLSILNDIVRGFDSDSAAAATRIPTSSSMESPAVAISTPENHLPQSLDSPSATTTTATETAVNGTMSPGIISSYATATGKPRNSGTVSSITASPTVQEGFFNSVTKRLQQVEMNLTLSLKYIEDQSRHMQEALQRAEQKQLTTVALFLDNLNNTVLAELRNVRDQYDQIWQSTVLALESQRDQSERDTLALSTRLNLLADEVVFQKRMAIMQAVLLLSCLFLVIFSRGVPMSYLSPLLDQSSTAPYMTPTSAVRHRINSYRPSPVFSQNERDAAMVHPTLHDTSIDGGVRGAYLHTASQESPESLDLRINAAEQSQGQGSSLEWERLSPPPTPSLRATLGPSDLHTSGRCSQAHSQCRSPCLQHTDNRKPLPSLPEHPTSP